MTRTAYVRRARRLWPVGARSRVPGRAGRVPGPLRRSVGLAVVLFVSCRAADPSGSVEVRVAVAGNFTQPFREVSRRFTRASRVTVDGVFGSTGQLYAQIRHGAPFDVFLAADTTRPARLESEGLAVPGSRFTYAVGQLALYAPGWDSVGVVEQELASRTFRHLAIANPHTAPYGAAAREALVHWGLWERWEEALVRGENISQAFAFVRSGAAEAGLVAQALVMGEPVGTYRLVDPSAYSPILQQAVLLRAARDRPAAEAFLDFLRSDEGRDLVAGFGYRVP